MNKKRTGHTPIQVFHSYPKWGLSGVNSWTINLARGTEGENFKHEVLFTGIPKQSCPELDDIGINYSFLDLPQQRPRKSEWQALKHFLERHAPCIYITNYDFHRSCAVGTLSPDVRVITIIHSDEACYFDELKRIGCNCDAIVCVSSYLTRLVKQRFPKLAERVAYIPHGIPLPSSPLSKRPQGGPLRLCYCNRLQQYQKRVFDLPLIAAELEKIGVDYELDIAGDGPDAEGLKRRFEAANLTARVRFHGRISNAAVMNLYKQCHLFLLTSDFEGLPLSLLEAMSVGCVPVAYEMKSGIKDAITHRKTGFIVPNRDVTSFARIVRDCAIDLNGLQPSASACQREIAQRFSLERMAKDYVLLFKRILTAGSHPVRSGRISTPYDLTWRGRGSRKIKRLFAHATGSRRGTDHNV